MAPMAYGDGTGPFQRKSGPRVGYWVKRYKTADGKWHATSWKPGPRPTRAMVQTRIAELSRTSPSQTESESVAAYLERWLRDGTTQIRGRTLREYRRLVDHAIRPALGLVPLATLSTPDIQQWVNSGATHHALAVLRAGLSEAVRWGLIPVNPARLVRPPKRTTRQHHVLSTSDLRLLLAQVRGDPLEALYVLAVTTGMRQGEILGLSWSDVDLKGGTLTVNASLWWKPGKDGREPLLTEPKTTRSRRRINLSPQARAALSEHRRTSLLNSKDGLVFTRPDGTALQPWAVWRALQRHLEAAGLPATTFHSLRHSAATMLLESGMDVASVSELLGHSSPYTTMTIYAHSVEHRRAAVAERVGQLLEGAG